MKLLLSLLLAALTFSASADVIIYKLKLTTAETGAGYSFKYSNAGYAVMDADTGDVWQIITDPKAKTYYLLSLDGIQIDEVEGAQGKRFAIITQNDEWQDTDGYWHLGQATIKGANVPNVNIGATSLYNIPKSFKWIGRAVGSYTTGETYHDEITGSLTLDAKSSTTSNLAGDDVFDALDRLESSLISIGYREE